MIFILAALLTRFVHASSGPHGLVLWVQPPHMAAGAGIIRGHLTGWLAFQR